MAAQEPPVVASLALLACEQLLEYSDALRLERHPALEEQSGAEQRVDGPLAKPRSKLAQERLEPSCAAEPQRAAAHLEALLPGGQQVERAWVACQPAPPDAGPERVLAPCRGAVRVPRVSPWLSSRLRLLQLPPRLPERPTAGSASAPVPRARGLANSSESFFR